MISFEDKNNKLTIEISEKAYDVLDEIDVTFLGIDIQNFIMKKLNENRSKEAKN